MLINTKKSHQVSSWEEHEQRERILELSLFSPESLI